MTENDVKSSFLDDFIASKESVPLAKALLDRYRQMCRAPEVSESAYSSELRGEFEEFIKGK